MSDSVNSQSLQSVFESTVPFGVVLWIVIALLVVVIALLVAMVLYVRKQRVALMPEMAQQAILNAEERAQAIVADAQAQARDLRNELEKERTRALHEDHQSVERFLDAYRFNLEKTIKELSYGVEKEHMRATTRFVESLQAIEQRVAMNAEEAKHSMDSFTDQSSQLFTRLSHEIANVEKGIQHLALALEEAAVDESDRNAEIVRKEMQKIGQETAKSVTEVAAGLDKALRMNIEKEFAAITSELSEYREARMRAVNERLLLLLEETAQIALQKKLSLQDQADLVYRSLEEAKRRGVFV